MNSNKSTFASRAAPFQAVAAGPKSPATCRAAVRSASSSRSTASAGMRGMRGNALIISLAIIAFAGSVVWFLLSVAEGVLNTPYVHTSYSTGECVAVIAPDGSDLGCENKPERYHHVWVE